MSNLQSWCLTYTSTLQSKNKTVAVVAALEDVVLEKETKKFSLKCRSQLMANEVFIRKKVLINLYIFSFSHP